MSNNLFTLSAAYVSQIILIIFRGYFYALTGIHFFTPFLFNSLCEQWFALPCAPPSRVGLVAMRLTGVAGDIPDYD